MKITFGPMEAAKRRIQAQIDQYMAEADEEGNQEAIVLRAVADGLEEALSIMEQEMES